MKIDFKSILSAIGAFFVSLGKKTWDAIVKFFKNSQSKKWIWLFVAGFVAYITIEVLFTGLLGGMVGFRDKVYFSFAGYSSAWMGIIGGVLLIVLGKLNGIAWIKKQSLFVQALIGTVIILLTEFVSGCILNLFLGLNLWNYSHIWLNLFGQINLFYGIFWFFLCPFAFWADDTLRWVFYKTGICEELQAPYNLAWFYKQLFSFKPIEFPITTAKRAKKK